jgi:uncharacterized membrane protein
LKSEFHSAASGARRVRVFLCHSSGDKEVVRELYRRLKADGFVPWLDEKDLLPGQDWEREITRAVQKSDVVVVCLSVASTNKKGFVNKEIKFALDVADLQPEGPIYLIPLRLDSCVVPQRLVRWHWVNFFEEDGYYNLVRSLNVSADAQESAPEHSVRGRADPPETVQPERWAKSQSIDTPPSSSSRQDSNGEVPRKQESESTAEIAGSSPKTEKIEDFLTPASFVRAANAADKNFRYALVIAGLLALVVIFAKFGIAYITLIFGAIALIGLMVLYFVFTQALKLKKSQLDLPAQVLVWTVLFIVIAIAGCLSSSVFFNSPLPFKGWIVENLPRKGASVAIVTSTPPHSGPADKAGVEREVLITEMLDAYKATGWQLAFFDDWGRPPTRQTLRVNQGVLVGTAADGRTVSISVDPDHLPTPQYYNARIAQISSLGKEAPEVVAFLTHTEITGRHFRVLHQTHPISI